ncbi:MAG: hypothetical protein HY302_04080 [Opitutae bacterium]|nr:hypothetical protein [Opitutae bacterium]
MSGSATTTTSLPPPTAGSSSTSRASMRRTRCSSSTKRTTCRRASPTPTPTPPTATTPTRCSPSWTTCRPPRRSLSPWTSGRACSARCARPTRSIRRTRPTSPSSSRALRISSQRTRSTTEFAATCGLDSCGSELARDSSPAASKLAPTIYATLHAPTPWRAGCYDIGVDVRVDTSFRQRANHYGTTAATVEALHAAASREVERRRTKDETQNYSAPSTFATRPSTSAVDPRPSTSAVAVFFPSYAYAESVLRALEHDGSVLRATLQPRLPDLAAQAAWVEEHLVFSDALFLVLGSSFAESIDLLGGRVSHAMVVGPALPEVNAVQKARMDTLSNLGRDGAFKRVYQVPGLQKVNQALGRLVRAPGQHAKVLLHCRRFADPGYASLLARDYQFGREIATAADLQAWLSEERPPPE